MEINQSRLTNLCKDKDFIEEFKKQIKKRIKMKSSKPKIIISWNSLWILNKCLQLYNQPLKINDIQKMFLHIARTSHNIPPRWCKFLRKDAISSIIVIVLNNIACNDKVLIYDNENDSTEEGKEVKHYLTCLNNFKETIERNIYFVHTERGQNFIDKIIRTPVTLVNWREERDDVDLDTLIKDIKLKYSTIESATKLVVKNSTFDSIVAEKTSLLLNGSQMARLRYPLPSTEATKNYQILRSRFEEVSNTSPMFAIDCEMVVVGKRVLRAGWIAVVDENLNCIYETLIRPEEEVINYVTRISGLTKRKLKNCKKTLDNVFEDLRRILPRDAILVGHSLQNDLHSLKMIYPYVIDTSIIYNMDGQRGHFPSLKKLTAFHLGQIIQQDGKNHNPVEDARATMMLAKLKLNKGVIYGDAVVSGTSIEDELGEKIFKMEDKESVRNFVYETGVGITKDLFGVISETRRVINVDKKSQGVDIKNADNVHCKSNRSILSTVLNVIENNHYDFILTQFHVKKSRSVDQIKKLNRYIERIYDKSQDNSFICLLLPGEHDYGQLFITIKNNQSLDPIDVNGVLLPHDFSPKVFLEKINT